MNFTLIFLKASVTFSLFVPGNVPLSLSFSLVHTVFVAVLVPAGEDLLLLAIRLRRRTRARQQRRPRQRHRVALNNDSRCAVSDRCPAAR